MMPKSNFNPVLDTPIGEGANKRTALEFVTDLLRRQDENTIRLECAKSINNTLRQYNNMFRTAVYAERYRLLGIK